MVLCVCVCVGLVHFLWPLLLCLCCYITSLESSERDQALDYIYLNWVPYILSPFQLWVMNL